MGFLDVIVKVGKGIVKMITDDVEKAKEYREEYRDWNDDSLKDKLRGGSNPQKVAAIAELESRGYKLKD